MRSVQLQVGVPVRVAGVYVAHWELPRFELRLRHRPRPVRCGLVTTSGDTADVFEAAGVAVPADWRHHPGLQFDVVADVTPLQEGRFGHHGLQRWRLRVDRWVSVAAHT